MSPRFWTLDLDTIHPNPWNPNRQSPFIYQKELASIRKYGFIVPMIVRPDFEGYELVDGEHRWRAARELGLLQGPAYDIGKVSDATARQLTIVLNELHGEPDPEKLSDLLKELITSTTVEELLETLPYTEPQLRELAKLPDFDWTAFEDQTKQRGSGDSWVERIYRMPPDAAAVLDQALSKVKSSEAREIPDWKALELISADYLGG